MKGAKPPFSKEKGAVVAYTSASDNYKKTPSKHQIALGRNLAISMNRRLTIISGKTPA
jgi:hypothetical protein